MTVVVLDVQVEYSCFFGVELRMLVELQELRRGCTFPIAPMPMMPSFKPLVSVHGTRLLLHRPARADFSAWEVLRIMARVRNIAMSAVGSETA